MERAVRRKRKRTNDQPARRFIGVSEAFGPIMDCGANFLMRAPRNVCVLARHPAGLARQSQRRPSQTAPYLCVGTQPWSEVREKESLRSCGGMTAQEKGGGMKYDGLCTRSFLNVHLLET